MAAGGAALTFWKGYREEKIDKRDETTRTNAMVSIDGRREETKEFNEEEEAGGKGKVVGAIRKPRITDSRGESLNIGRKRVEERGEERSEEMRVLCVYIYMR